MGRISKIILISLIAIGATGCSKEPETTPLMEEMIPVTSYDRSDYKSLYNQLEEGMSIEEVSKLFGSDGDDIMEEHWEGGKKYQTIDWYSHDRKSNIGCDFIDDICSYKNGWTVKNGKTVWERE